MSVRVRDQFQRHSVALISLAVALSGLAYNTWRNERTEANRNVRMAGFEVLLNLGKLDRVVFFSHYEKDSVRGSPREGWAYALVIRDMAGLTAEPAISSSLNLVEVWSENWSGLGENDAARNRISEAIDQLRSDTLAVLAELD